MPSLADDVVAAAAGICYRAKLAALECAATERLANRAGISLAPLWPPAEVIQVVALDGVHVGRVRLDGPRSGRECWYAVPTGPWRTHGPYRSATAAARALVAALPDRCPTVVRNRRAAP